MSGDPQRSRPERLPLLWWKHACKRALDGYDDSDIICSPAGEKQVYNLLSQEETIVCRGLPYMLKCLTAERVTKHSESARLYKALYADDGELFRRFAVLLVEVDPKKLSLLACIVEQLVCVYGVAQWSQLGLLGNYLKTSGLKVASEDYADTDVGGCLFPHMDGPGKKSLEGPRHDNDYTDFRRIKFLPTMSEVMATRVPYWPESDLRKQLYSQPMGSLDRSVRLVREETFIEARRILKAFLISKETDEESIKEVEKSLPRYTSPRSELRFTVYENVVIAVPTINQQYNIRFNIEFDEVEEDALPWDAFCCIITPSKDFLFVYSQNMIDFLNDQVEGDEPKHCLSKNSVTGRYIIPFKLAEESFDTVNRLVHFVGQYATRCTLVDFWGLRVNVLTALCHNLRRVGESNLPFREILSNVVNAVEGCDETPAPISATAIPESFVFRPTELDSSQLEALLAALRSSFTLVQGPPGTGKSHFAIWLINTLLGYRRSSIDDTELVPIVCTCYSNRALDCLLEGCLEVGLTNILRVGGFCRSEALQPYVYQSGRRRPPMSKIEGVRLRSVRKIFKSTIGTCLSEISSSPLTNSAPSSTGGSCLNTGTSGDGKTSVALLLQTVLQDLRRNRDRQENEEKKRLRDEMRNYHVIGVTTSGLAMRREIFESLKVKTMIIEEAGQITEAHVLGALLPTLERLVMIGDHQQLQPSVQVREFSRDGPYGTRYAQDISLFEAFSESINGRPRLPVFQLSVQRRMHPMISAITRRLFYPLLVDAPSVHDRPLVRGLSERVYWMTHAFEEVQVGVSIANPFEVDFVFGVVKHLVWNNHSVGEMVIVTFYSAQLEAMKEKFERAGYRTAALLDKGEEDEDIEKNDVIRISTVDGFQGAEANIVILSLCRSNSSGNIGFLRSSNRINVALSRAKSGLIIIGNSATFSQDIHWKEVQLLLQTRSQIGPALPLACQVHADERTLVSSLSDFDKKSPFGGCRRPCSRLLTCGHQCPSCCHSKKDHYSLKCPKETSRFLPCGHEIFAPCSEDLSEYTCHEVIEPTDVPLPCGHYKTVRECHQTINKARLICYELVQKLFLQCQHQTDVVCSKISTALCDKCA